MDQVTTTTSQPSRSTRLAWDESGIDGLHIVVADPGSLTSDEVEHFLHVLAHAINTVAAVTQIDAQVALPEEQSSFVAPTTRQTILAVCNRNGGRFSSVGPREIGATIKHRGLYRSKPNDTISIKGGSTASQIVENAHYDVYGAPFRKELFENVSRTAEHLEDRSLGKTPKMVLSELQMLEGVISTLDLYDLEKITKRWTEAVPAWNPIKDRSEPGM
jgi:hypothetical protein